MENAGTNRRTSSATLPWRSFRAYLSERFPWPVQKLPIAAGFTCPNIDGTRATGGCAYCNNLSFSPSTRGRLRTIREQVEAGVAYYRSRGHAGKFLAYFQAHTNTHAPVERLRAAYDEALAHPDVAALAVGTRPDCLSDPTVDLLASYAKGRETWVEVGLESAFDDTLRWMNRAHTAAEFEDAVARLRARGLLVCAHVILGLPGDDRERCLATAAFLARTVVDGVKLHHLYVAKNTVLERWHADDDAGRPPEPAGRPRVRLWTLEEYVSLAADVLERLPERTVIQRLCGEFPGRYVVAPDWGVRKAAVVARIAAELRRRGTRQGGRCDAGSGILLAAGAPVRNFPCPPPRR